MKWMMLIFLICRSMLTMAFLPYDDPGLPGEDPDLPIDGGISFLLIAGAIYGIRKISHRKREQN